MSDEFPRRPEDIRLDRDTTREELAETMEALGRKLDVKTRASEAVDEKLDHAEIKVADVAGARTAVKFRRGAEAVRGNPVPVFAGVLGLVILIRLILRWRSA